MIRYALDTNVVSELMRPQPHPRVVSRLTQRRMACAVPAPVVDELQYGIGCMGQGERRRLHQLWLERLLEEFPVIPIDALCAQWHGRERARLALSGWQPALYDGLIASAAVVNELTLVTRNGVDFERFTGIRLEDWFA